MSVTFRRMGIVAVLVGLFLPACLSAQSLETSVSYVGAEFLYIQAGSSSGVAKGDSAEITRDGNVLAQVVVLRTSAGFSACSLPMDGGVDVKVGDRAVVRLSEIDITSTPETKIRAARVTENNLTRGQIVVDERRDQGPQFWGRVTLGYRLTDDREPADRDITEPWGYFSFTLSGLPTDYHELRVRARLRRIERSGYRGAAAYQNWNNRIYQVSLGYTDPNVPLNYQAGRILARDVTGLGVMDGALGSYRLSEQLKLGLFSGWVPDPITSEFATEETQSGAFVAGRGSLLKGYTSATLAWIGRYRSGEINRESIYQQLRYDLGNATGFYQSAELEINRDWRRDVVGQSATLSNLLLQVRTDPIHNIRLEVGYDSRRQVQDWRTRDLPDSLFDDALRQGWRGSLRWKAPMSLVVMLGGGLRTREGEAKSTRSSYAGVSATRLPWRMSAATTVRYMVNPYTEATLVSATLSKQVGRRIYLRGRTGSSFYTMRIDGSTVSYTWIGCAADIELGRGLFASLDGEVTSGYMMNTQRYSVELGYRFH